MSQKERAAFVAGVLWRQAEEVSEFHETRDYTDQMKAEALRRYPDETPAQEPVPDLVEQLSGLKNDWTSAGAKTYGLPPSPPPPGLRERVVQLEGAIDDFYQSVIGSRELWAIRHAHHSSTGHSVSSK